MAAPAANFYAEWRQLGVTGPALREGAGSPPESLLQSIWQQQRLRRDRLRTLDGRILRVLHPGFRNHEGGPDFRGAVVLWNEDLPVTGDVEVDLEASGWHGHGHDRNPNFRGVILRVVWQAPRVPDEGPPLLPVADVLDAPLAELAVWLATDPSPALPDALRGRCAAPLRELSDPLLGQLLDQAARVRFEGKALQLAARAREAGWEQALWEGLFRALGYKHNTWPMQRLAELRPRWHTEGLAVRPLQARLLGIAGLLPGELSRARPEADNYVRCLWDGWWRERDVFADCQLPRTLWRLHGLRPDNHPQRRLALAAHWLARKTFLEQLTEWGARLATAEDASKRLADVLRPGRDEFWSTHLTLRSPGASQPRALLGAARVTDLAVNVILPWLAARARESGRVELTEQFEGAFLRWPAGEDNAVLKLARERLLGGPSPRRFRTAASQQGLLQIVRDFCDASNAVCEGCRFPELVGAWQSTAAAQPS
jgi:hypothetical protein